MIMTVKDFVFDPDSIKISGDEQTFSVVHGAVVPLLSDQRSVALGTFGRRVDWKQGRMRHTHQNETLEKEK